MLVLTGPLLVIVATPLWLRLVPPNRLYGVRTRATLADEARWYEVNARSGRDLAVAGALLMAGTFLIDSLGSTWVLEMRTLASAVLLIVLLAWVSLRALR